MDKAAAETRRLARRDSWESAFSPGPLALAGAALSLTLLFLPGLSGRLFIFAFAALCAWACGRRLSVATTAIVMAGIVGANLLVPLGRVLVKFGPIIITETALLEGLEKAVSFEALVLLSKASLSPALRIPGKLGSFFSEALRTYERVLEHKLSIHATTFFRDIDAVLISVYDETETIGSVAAVSRQGSKNKLLWAVACVGLLAVFLSAIGWF
ncbi:MAG TPA: hypothetical protein PLC54_00305 [Spirochaetales bacterium]|nr:hypothetical protein [Spirochaetales bacterium]